MRFSHSHVPYLLILLSVLPFSSLPFAVFSPQQVPALKPGMSWSLAGTNTFSASGTGSYQGSFLEEDKFVETWRVESLDGNNATLTKSDFISWEATLSGWFKSWWGAGNVSSAFMKLNGTVSDVSKSGFSVDRLTSRMNRVPEDMKSSKNCPAWFIMSPQGVDVGSSLIQCWSGSEVPFRVENAQAKIEGLTVDVWKASYSGAAVGQMQFIKDKPQVGNETEDRSYDKDFGFLVAGSSRGSYQYNDSSGSIHDTFAQDYSLKTSNVWIAVSLDILPRQAPMLVDGSKYLPNDMPKSFLWVNGSAHTISVDSTVADGVGVRYVFLQWTDGNKDASRTIAPTAGGTYEASYKTQYELVVNSQHGASKGSDWYDAGSTATFSVNSPLVMEGFMGMLGAKYVFDHWNGDSTAATASASVTMDGPKTVTAEWRSDNTTAYFITGAIGTALIIIIVLVLLTKRKKRQLS